MADYTLSVKITGDSKDVEKALKNVQDGLEQTEQKSGKFGEVMKRVGQIAATATAAIAAGLVALTKKAVNGYADMEQNLGGIQTIYGDAWESVYERAQQAYKEAGISANQYMEQATRFGASLLQSTGGDVEKAADAADRAMKDMSDNANKFGTDITRIQDAYAGFARGQYTMLDNLSLGYGGTRTEMERLLKDAQEFSGVEYNIDNLSDVYEAIHVVQEQLGITGTTAKEASSTLSGSFAAAKGAIDNFLAGAGNVSDVVDTIKTAAKNLAGALKTILPEMTSGLVEIVNGLIPEIPSLVSALLPAFISGITNLISGIVSALPALTESILAIVPQIARELLTLLPMIADSIMTITPMIMSIIGQMAPTLIPVLVDGILALIMTVSEPQYAELMATASVQLILGIVEGIIRAIPSIIQAIPMLIQNIIGGVLAFTGEFFTTGYALFMEMLEGMGVVDFFGRVGEWFSNVFAAIKGWWDKVVDTTTQIWDTVKNVVKTGVMLIGSILSAAWNIITLPFRLIWENCRDKVIEIWTAIKNFLEPYITAIGNFFSSVWEGITNAVSAANEAIRNTVSNVWNAIKGFLSPILQGIGNTFSTVFNNIKTNVTNAFNNIKSIATSVMNAVKSAVETPLNAIKNTFTKVMDNAKSVVQNGLNAIKSAFSNLSLKFPNIKLPHFSISGKLSINPPSVPKLDIKWYAKAMANGAICSSPTLLGGDVMGVGERGAEVVVGAHSLEHMIRQAVNGASETAGNTTINVYGAEGQDVMELANIVVGLINNDVERRSAVYA